jgi:hypothetical protein
MRGAPGSSNRRQRDSAMVKLRDRQFDDGFSNSWNDVDGQGA